MFVEPHFLPILESKLKPFLTDPIISLQLILMCLVAIGSRDDATRQRLHENFIQPIVSKVGGYDNPPDHINYARGKLNSNVIKQVWPLTRFFSCFLFVKNH